MSRAIKFRAWDGLRMTINGIMFSNTRGDLFSAAQMPVMQFTGLLDKSDKEIYEGDIVRDVSHTDLVFAVEWDKPSAGYYMPDEFDEEYKFPMSAADLEIIGNIHENPELLEVA